MVLAVLFCVEVRIRTMKCNSPADCCSRRLDGAKPLFLPSGQKCKRIRPPPPEKDQSLRIGLFLRLGIWRADSKGRSKQTVRWTVCPAVARPQASESVLPWRIFRLPQQLCPRFVAKNNGATSVAPLFMYQQKPAYFLTVPSALKVTRR